MSELPQFQPPIESEWSAPTHYATVEGDVLQVPEYASSVHISELSDQTPAGKLRPIQLPDTNGTLQTWFKEGLGTDANGEQRVALSSADAENTQHATMSVEQFARAREAARKRLGALATGLPEPKPASPEPVRAPYVEPEIYRRVKRPTIVEGVQDPQPRRWR